MLTFEQLKLTLHKWAHHFQNEKYEHWELINAVWAMGSVQKLHINLASKRIKYDMMDYMRSQENFRRRQRDEDGGVFVPKYISMQTLIGDDCEFLETLECRVERNSGDTEDYFNWIVSGFSRREKLVVKLYFIKNFTMAEISRVIGVTESRISQILTNSLKRIRVRLCAVDPELKKRGSPETITLRSLLKPEEKKRKRADYIRYYMRDYYQKNKKRILANNTRSLQARKIA